MTTPWRGLKSWREMANSYTRMLGRLKEFVLTTRKISCGNLETQERFTDTNEAISGPWETRTEGRVI